MFTKNSGRPDGQTKSQTHVKRVWFGSHNHKRRRYASTAYMTGCTGEKYKLQTAWVDHIKAKISIWAILTKG